MNWKPPRKTISDLVAIHEASDLPEDASPLAQPREIAFEREELLMSLARTLTLNTPVEDLSQQERQQFALALAHTALTRIELCTEKGNSEFCFSNRVNVLADNVRTSFPGEIGAAVSDLAMEQFGFHWRANGREVRFVVPDGADDADNRLPDFVYSPGGQSGFRPTEIIAVEAKGSISKTGGTRPAVSRLAKSAFKGQVRKYLGAEADDCVVAAGFAVAFGAVPGSNASSVAIASSRQFAEVAQGVPADLSAAASGEEYLPLPKDEEEHEHEHEHDIEPWRRKLLLRRPAWGRDLIWEVEPARDGDSGDGGGRGGERRGGRRRRGRPSARVALASYEAVFQMCGAFAAADFIRGLLSGRRPAEREAEELVETFMYLDGPEPVLRGLSSFYLGQGFIGVAAASAVEILETLSGLTDVPVAMELGVIPPDGRRVAEEGRRMFFQGDGLAYVSARGTSWRSRQWDLGKGRWLD